MTLALLVLGWFGIAQAAEAGIVVESAPAVARDAAVADHGRIQEALDGGKVEGSGAAEIRLVRRFYPGEGWRYLVVVEGLPTERDARALSRAVGGLKVIVPEGEDGGAAPVALAQADEEVADPRITPREKRASERGTLDVLRAAVAAHGGVDGGSSRLAAASSVRFTFQRKIPEADGELVAVNHYLRKGDARRLAVEIKEGDGRSSLTVLTPDQEAYLAADGEIIERDSGRTLAILERFSPESILAIPLGLSEDVETAAAWRALALVGTERRDKRDVVVLATGPGDGAGLKEAAFDARSRQLVEVTWVAEDGSGEDGEYTFFYDDYRELEPGLVVPFYIRIERDGALVEEIEVSRLELDPLLEDSLFEAAQFD